MIKFNSATHDLLQVAKSMGRPFSTQEAMRVMVSLDKPSRVKECANILIVNGLLQEISPAEYEITERGEKHLYFMVSQRSSR